MPKFSTLDTLRQHIIHDPELSTPLLDIIEGQLSYPWGTSNGLILYKKQIYLPKTSSLLAQILSGIDGASHEGIQKTLHRMCTDLYVPRARRIIRDFIHDCIIFQLNKMEHFHPEGLL